MPNGRCANHGGKATGRPVIHGRRSKFLPVRLQERAEEALADSELVSMVENLALIDALIVERYGLLGDDAPAIAWAEALACFNRLDGFTADGSLSMEAKAGEQFERLRDILTRGGGAATAEAQIVALQEHARKLSETEIKRQAVLNQFVSAKQMNVLIALILTAARETVKDSGERAALGAKLAMLLRKSVGRNATELARSETAG